MPKRRANAQWNGNLMKGTGTMALGSGAFEGNYSFGSRFEEKSGTNPEELIGAAHAGCFSMAFANILSEGGHEPESIKTEATVNLEKTDSGFAITTIHLDTEVQVSGIDDADFQKEADKAKENCPVSKALAGVKVELSARLIKSKSVSHQ